MGKNGKGVETILRPGQILDHKYRVEKLIGLGGMAAVWAGVNKRTGKRVVLKMILQSLADSEEVRERFRREAWPRAASTIPTSSLCSTCSPRRT